MPEPKGGTHSGGFHFHILGSKLKGAGFPMISFLKSLCSGLIRRLFSSGISADGTKRMQVFFCFAHSVPMA